MQHRAFALPDLIALLAAGTVGSAAFLAVQPPGGADGGDPAAQRARDNQLRDAVQIRGITQAMIIFANNNKDAYPLPSSLDTANTTVASTRPDGRNKDTTANIISALIFNGMISPELCVSPAEVKASIGIDGDYQYDQPKAAVKPAEALWDPAFSADFQAGGGGKPGEPAGNVSYAHLQPSKGRLSMWSTTFNSAHAQFGNRGPEIAGVGRDEKGNVLDVKTALANSNTFRIHGTPDAWEGNIAFADGHIDFLGNLNPPPDVRYFRDPEKFAKGEDGTMLPDVLFWDEPEDTFGTNAFLGIFTKAGDLPNEFTAIWD